MIEFFGIHSTPFSVSPTPFTPLNWGRRRNLVLGF